MIHINPNQQPLPRRMARPGPTGWVLFTALVITSVSLQACKKEDAHAEGDGHDHSKEAPAEDHAAGDAHDHGGGEEAHTDEVKITDAAVDRYGVLVADAQLWALRPTVVSAARVAFNTEAMAHVGTPLRGRIVEIKVRLGDTATAGQELLIIESPELGEAQADLLLKRTAVVTAGPTVELAKMSWERGKALYEKSEGLSLTEVQQREAQYKAAVAAQKSAEAAATAAENRLRLLGMKQDQITGLLRTGEINPRLAIEAAIGGVVVQREVTLGELVGPDQESLMVLADTSTLWVLADVPEAKLMGLVSGAKAWVTLGSHSAAEPGERAPHRFEGTVSFIAPIVDPTTRTAQVRIEVPATDVTLKPGMFALAEIVLSNVEDGGAEPPPVVAVPDEAIQTVEGGPAVFVPVPNEPNTFAKRAITVGKPVGTMVPILSGLVEGERFVIAGSFILKAEMGKAGAAHEH